MFNLPNFIRRRPTVDTIRTAGKPRKVGPRTQLSVEAMEQRLVPTTMPTAPVPPPETDYFLVTTNSAAQVTSGATVSVTVTEYAYATGKPASTISGATVPLVASDGGHSYTVGSVVMNGSTGTGTATLKVADTVEIFASVGSLAYPKTYITGATTNSIKIVSGPTQNIAFTGTPSSVTIGTPFNLAITATDANGNPTNGTATLSVNGNMAMSASSVPFANGAGSVSMTLTSAVAGTLTAGKTVQFTATVGAAKGTGNVVVNPDFFSQNLGDLAIQNLARTDFKRDGTLTYGDMIAIFAAAENENPTSVTSVEMASLRSLTANASYLKLSPSIAVLAGKVIGGDPTNTVFSTISSTGTVVTGALSNLAVGSTTANLKNLVGKWFLGDNDPADTVGTGAAGGGPTITPSYSVNNGPAFSAGESANLVNYFDVQQGQVSDCWVMVTAGEAAAHDPSAIFNMITLDGVDPANNANVYTVRFFKPSGAADYITVDSELPAGGTIFASATHNGPGLTTPATALWVAILEKAYAQENSESFLPSRAPGVNSYQSINWINVPGTPSYVNAGTAAILQAYTGVSGGAYSISSGASAFTSLGAALQSDPTKMIVLGTGGTTAAPPAAIGGVNIVPAHMYGVLNYANGQFTLFNPWGYNGAGFTNTTTGANVFCAGTVKATPAQMGTDFIFATTVGTAPARPTPIVSRLADGSSMPSAPTPAPVSTTRIPILQSMPAPVSTTRIPILQSTPAPVSTTLIPIMLPSLPPVQLTRIQILQSSPSSQSSVSPISVLTAPDLAELASSKLFLEEQDWFRAMA